ncbi:hypothetical protein Tco_0544384, partial [Tanacetum coccineum]
EELIRASRLKKRWQTRERSQVWKHLRLMTKQITISGLQVL